MVFVFSVETTEGFNVEMPGILHLMCMYMYIYIYIHTHIYARISMQHSICFMYIFLPFKEAFFSYIDAWCWSTDWVHAQQDLDDRCNSFEPWWREKQQITFFFFCQVRWWENQAIFRTYYCCVSVPGRCFHPDMIATSIIVVTSWLRTSVQQRVF